MSNKLNRYEKIELLGEGQFATVYKARDVENNNIVAVKKVKLGNRLEAQDGFDRSALSEIKHFRELHHQNVIRLLDVYGYMSNVALVFDFMDTTLEVIIKDSTIILTTAHIKAYMIQILLGLDYLHKNWVLHRDLKPSKLLVNTSGVLKVGDFGVAKLFVSPNRMNPNEVISRWYKPPELLHGAKLYSTGVDMWAVGCVLAELLLRYPLFPGDSDRDQLIKIFGLYGNPLADNFPGLKSMLEYIEFQPFIPMPLKNVFPTAGDDLLDVIRRLFVLNPMKRVDCYQCLEMPFFNNRPVPTMGSRLPLPQYIREAAIETARLSLKRKFLGGADGGSFSKRQFL